RPHRRQVDGPQARRPYQALARRLQHRHSGPVRDRDGARPLGLAGAAGCRRRRVASDLADPDRRTRRPRRLPRQVPLPPLDRLAAARRHRRRAAGAVTDPAAFVRAQTALASPPLVPEIRLHLASAVTPLWRATEATLAAREVPPPYWAFAWPGGQALARYVLDHCAVVRDRSVLDFAAGSGLAGIA